MSTGNPHGVSEQPPGPEIFAVRCSACNTLYRVASEDIPRSGRRVKCAACGHVWFQDIPPARMASPHSRPQKLHSAEPPVRGREEFPMHDRYEQQSEEWEERMRSKVTA